MLNDDEIWLEAYLKGIEAIGDSRNIEMPTLVADKCLADYKSRFKKLGVNRYKKEYLSDGFHRFSVPATPIKSL